MTAAQLKLRPPTTRDELWWAVLALFDVKIPRTKVCPDHCSPFDAFADAYFNECTIGDGDPYPISRVIWHASRGLAGKSKTLSVLGLTFTYLDGADTTILGGSMAQSANVHDYMVKGMESDLLPIDMVVDQTASKIILTNKGRVRPLPASQRNVRGPHPSKLLMDEVDEMELDIYDAALGQPLPQPNWNGLIIPVMTVVSSTWQNASGTLSEIFRRAEEQEPINDRGDARTPIYRWCYKESANPIDGWLTEATIQDKKDSVSAEMFRIEYDLGEPSIGNRAIDTDKLKECYCIEPDEPGGSPIWEKHTKDWDEWRFAKRIPGAVYSVGTDWAKEQDKTVIQVARTDLPKREIVYLARINRTNYPRMVGLFNEALKAYEPDRRSVWHDSTGLGNVINDYVDIRANPFQMTGVERAKLLSDYVNALEKVTWRLPKMLRTHYLEHQNCVGIGSLVRTLDGRKPIEEVQVGDRVLTRAGWRRVEATWDNGVRPVVLLRASDGKELVLTPDHAVATGRGWTRADALEEGDVLYVVLASATGTASRRVDDQITPFIGVSEGAASDAGAGSRDAVSAPDILSLGDSFEMIGAHACPGSAAPRLDVIDHQSVRDGADKDRIASSRGQSGAPSSPTVSARVDIPRPDPARPLDSHSGVDVVGIVDHSPSPPTAVSATHRLGLASDTLAIEAVAHVVSVTPIGGMRVFDLTIEGEHEFTASDIVVHNCSTGDLYSAEKKYHLPDTVCAGALAEYGAKRAIRLSAPVVLTRDEGAMSRDERMFSHHGEPGEVSRTGDPYVSKTQDTSYTNLVV